MCTVRRRANMKEILGLGIVLLVAAIASVDATSIRVKSPLRCGPICRMYCANGFVIDSRGCPICKCKPFAPPSNPVLPPTNPPILPFVIPPPVKPTVQCGPMCRMYCPNGFVKDTITGCPICKCNQAPSAVTRCPHGTKMALPRRVCRRNMLSYQGRWQCDKNGFCYSKGSNAGVCCRRRRGIKLG